MSLVTKNPFHEKHGQTNHKCLELWLHGYRVTPGPKFVEDQIKVGHVRFHKAKPRASIVGAPIVEEEENGIVHEHKWGGWVVHVKKASTLRDRLHFAHIVAFHMCGHRPSDPYVAEISRRLPIWLCDDGVTGRWMAQLQDMARKRLVVEAVLGG